MSGISFVGAASGTTSATVPAHSIGDLILVYAFRDGSTTAPSLGSGYTSIGTKAGTTCSARLGFKIATSTSDISGTWTNATETIVMVYSCGGSSLGTLGVGGNANVASTSNTFTWPAIATMTHTDGTSWVAGCIGHRSTGNSLSTPPTGMTNRVSVTGTAQAAGHDTNGGVSSQSSHSQTLTGTASGEVAWVAEITYTAPPPTVGVWDTSSAQAANFTFDSTFTIATEATFATNDRLKGIDAPSTGLRYAEVAYQTAGTTQASIGLCSGTDATATFVISVDCNTGGVTDHTGTSYGNIGVINNTDTVRFAVDFGHGVMWLSHQSAGSWLGNSGSTSAGDNPTIPSTGIPLSSLGSPSSLSIAIDGANTGQIFTLCTAPLSFFGARPAGYLPWYTPVGVPYVVQAGFISGTGTLVLGTPVLPGSAVAFFGLYATTTTSLADDQGNTYNLIDTADDVTDGGEGKSFLLGNITNGPQTYTLSGSFGSAVSLYLLEVVGANAASNPVDGHNAQVQTSVGTGVGALSSGSFSPTTAAMVVGVTIDITTSSLVSVAGGFTQAATDTSSSLSGYKLLSAAGSIAFQATAASSGANWLTMGLGVKPASSSVTNNVTVTIASVTALIKINSAGKKLAIASTTATAPAVKSVGKHVSIASVTALVRGASAIARSLAVASVTSLSKINSVGRVMALSSVSATSVITPRNVVRSLLIASTTGLSLARAMARTLPIASVSALTLVKTVSRSLALASVTALAKVKTVGKVLPLASITALALSKTVGKVLGIASLTATSVNAIKAFGVALLIACSSAVSVSTPRTLARALAIACTTALASSRSVLKGLAISSVTSLSMVKAIAKSVSISSITGLALSASKTFNRAVAIACTSALSSAKSVSRTVAVGCTTGLSKTIAVSKTVAVACASALSALAIKGRMVVVAIACSTAVTHSASIARTLAVGCTSAITPAKHVARSIAVGCASALSASRTVAKTVALSCASALAIAHGLALSVVVTIKATSATSVVRSISKQVSVASSSAVTTANAVAITLSVAVTSSTAVFKTFILEPLLISVSTTVVLVQQGGLSKFAKNAWTILGTATRYIITGSPITAAPVTPAPEPITIIGTVDMTIHPPLDFLCGTDWEMTGPLQDANGAPLDLTGATIAWRLDTSDNEANVLTLAIGSGITILNMATASILVDVTAAQTQNLTPGYYRDWLIVTLANGEVLPEWSGIIRAAAKPA